MSNTAWQEAGQNLADIADQINTDFNDVATMLPLYAKIGGAGLYVPVHRLEGRGSIGTVYQGYNSDIERNVLRLVMAAEGYGDDFGFYKDYELADYGHHRGGLPQEIEPATPNDLEWGCPGPVQELAFAIHALREDYLRPHAID